MVYVSNTRYYLSPNITVVNEGVKRLHVGSVSDLTAMSDVKRDLLTDENERMVHDTKQE